jgi:hypothetical protein
MVARDVDTLRMRIDHLMRSAGRIRDHAADLHAIGWEPHHGETEKVNGGTPDRLPRTGDRRARRLFAAMNEEVLKAEAELVGLERVMFAIFFAGSENPEPSRGSLIPAAEHDRLLARQRTRGDSPVRIVDQPAHPGKRR